MECSPLINIEAMTGRLTDTFDFIRSNFVTTILCISRLDILQRVVVWQRANARAVSIALKHWH